MGETGRSRDIQEDRHDVIQRQVDTRKGRQGQAERERERETDRAKCCNRLTTVSPGAALHSV